MMANVNFVVFKINDIDVCQLQQEKQTTVLDLLLNEETENIVLELKRKSCWNSYKNADFDDIEINKKMCFLKLHHNNTTNYCVENTNAISSEITVNLHLPPSNIQKYCVAKSTQTEDIAFYLQEHLRHIQKNTDRLIDHEHNLFEQSLAPEIDIEEITLRKSDSNERLGITVCYSNNEDIFGGEILNDATVTEVYISDIHPDSVAGRDGRLRQGDQILQINGKDIKTRLETETLIAENNNAVTLLISRYLYTDEDDFNDPSTNEEDDEVLIVEDDEDDDDDDEFYEENNMTYVNCVISNDCDCCINATEELDKALLSQVVQQEQFQQPSQKHEDKNCVIATNSSSSYQTNTVKSASDAQKEKSSKIGRKTSSLKCGKSSNITATKVDNIISRNDKAKDDYETEHIYETIPEDPEPETEPFYCSPYDSSVYVTAVASCTSSTITDALQHLQQKQRVAQWLGIKPMQDIGNTTAPRQYVRNNNSNGRSFAFGHKSATGTVRSIATSFANGTIDWGLANNGSCQIEDQDNSSSAYNTGGSNNSVSPLTLMFNPKNRCDQNASISTSAINLQTANGTSDDEIALQQMHHKNQKTNSPKEKCKITSPKGSTHTLKTNISAPANKGMDVHMPLSVNKEANVHQNMLFKQHLFYQKFNLEKTLQPLPHQHGRQSYYQPQQQHDQTHCPQFTAPNLSQYHFVSSQEVNNLSLGNKIPKTSTTVATTIANNKKEDETMVWKVKRRPDGTRYIVRRPAKNRVIKERNVRLNVERLRNDITTTEDDTISEIKTGRYWTREERKKHIEKAKERRQQQHNMLHQQHNKSHLPYDDSATTTLCIGDVSNTILHDSSERRKIKCQENVNLIRQSHKIANQQQHYQLQFNSTENHKLSTLIRNKESPTNKSSQTFPINSEDFPPVKGNMDKPEILNSVAFTLSEQNQINNVLQSVTTS